MQRAFGESDTADIRRVRARDDGVATDHRPDHDLCAAATEVGHDEWTVRRIQPADRTAERQSRLLIARDHLGDRTRLHLAEQ
ncbi:hypothetical protein MP11Mi_05160 [Gordonia sp. MP11Mi]|uniref:Uncharacterized protein n=1 Tax=Gordonia sp. MP11Mi TaxID=3022769 RepID=A0AA97CVE6_9ACTN